MATLAARGTGTPATTGTTWATVTNAVDGAAGTNPATYATATNAVASAVQTIEITGYGFSTSIASTDTLNSVTVSLRHFENNTGRFATVRFQAFDGATAIGTAFTCTLATAARNDTTTFPATLTQLRSATFKIVVTITGAASTQSRIESIDYVDVTADYTPTPPAITQAAYRLYADGTETGSTPLAAQDTGYTADTSAGDINLQVRARLQSTNTVAVPATDDWQLQYERNTSGTWNNVAAAAGPLVDNYSSTNANALNAPTAVNAGNGQSFLGNGQKLTRAGFFLSKIGTPPGTITSYLFAHGGTFGTTGVPTGTALATSTTVLTATSLGTTETWWYFDFDGTYTMTAGTPYVIVARINTATDISNAVRFAYDTSSPTHPGNRSEFGTFWLNDPSDLIFQVDSTSSTTAVTYNSPNLTDAAATTNRLSAGTGTFIPGKISETGLVTDLGWTANNHTEVLYSITLKQADLAPTDTLRFRILRNGVTTGLTYTQTPTITIGAGGPVARTGQATGTITLGSTTSGVRGRPGVATAALTLTGTASGAPTTPGVNVTGTATATLTLGASSTATRGTTATTTGALSLSGVATGLKVVRGAGTASLALDGHTAATRGITGQAAATLTLAGTATGTVTAGGTAHTGQATGQLTLTAATLGTRSTTGTATAQLTLGSTTTGTRQVRGTATGQATLTSLALGLVEGNAVGRALGQATLTGTAAGTRGRPGQATTTLALAGTASGIKQVRALALAHLTLVGTARAAGITTTPITGQWNGTTFNAMQYGDHQVVDWHMQPA